ncbi:MAG: hypothetical protein RIS06_699 [Actinomycetota bacterium]
MRLAQDRPSYEKELAVAGEPLKPHALELKSDQLN